MINEAQITSTIVATCNRHSRLCGVLSKVERRSRENVSKVGQSRYVKQKTLRQVDVERRYPQNDRQKTDKNIGNYLKL
jgi:hypothetical protein